MDAGTFKDVVAIVDAALDAVLDAALDAVLDEVLDEDDFMVLGSMMRMGHTKEISQRKASETRSYKCTSKETFCCFLRNKTLKNRIWN